MSHLPTRHSCFAPSFLSCFLYVLQHSDGDGKVDGGAGAVMGRPVGQATCPVSARQPGGLPGGGGGGGGGGGLIVDPTTGGPPTPTAK